MNDDLKYEWAKCTKIKAFDIVISDTLKEHTLMVFMIELKGNKLHAKSCTKDVKHCVITLDDCFSLDELLQDLFTLCQESINNSKRYTTED